MNTEYSKDAALFADEIEKFSKTKLNRKAELIRIYEESLKNDNESAFEDLIFTAKYVQGLMRIVTKENLSEEIKNIDQIKNDLSDNLNKVVSQLREIISRADDNLKLHFEETYFELTQQGFLNLNELLSDLEWAKKYTNEFKRHKNS